MFGGRRDAVGWTAGARPKAPAAPLHGQARRVTPWPGASVRRQRQSVPELEARERVVGQEQAAVEVDPLGEARDGRGRGDPHRGLLHAAEERPKAELAGACEHAGRRANAAALGELHVDAVDDADERVEVLDRHGRLVGDDRERRDGLQVAEPLVAPRRERLLDQLDAEADQLRDDRRGALGRPADVGVDPDRAVEDAANRLQRGEVVRAADLDLEGREARATAGPFGDDRRLVDAEREVGRRDRRREPQQPVDRQAQGLAREVVQGDVERALGRAVTADRALERGADRRQRGPGGIDAAVEVERLGRRRGQQQVHDDRHGSPGSRRSTSPGSPRRCRRDRAAPDERSSTTTVVTAWPSPGAYRAITNGSREREAERLDPQVPAGVQRHAPRRTCARAPSGQARARRVTRSPRRPREARPRPRGSPTRAGRPRSGPGRRPGAPSRRRPRRSPASPTPRRRRATC